MQNNNQMNFMRPNQSPNSMQPNNTPLRTDMSNNPIPTQMNNYQQPDYYQQPNYPPRNLYLPKGRVVYSENDIQPAEVPMDGSSAIFPLADWSRIFVKAWNQTGTISTTVYIPLSQNQPDVEDPVMEAISSIKGEMGKLQTTMRNIQNTLNKQNKKKVPNNE